MYLMIMHLLPEDRENCVRQKYNMNFSIFGQDSLNGKVVNKKGTKVKYIFGQNRRYRQRALDTTCDN